MRVITHGDWVADNVHPDVASRTAIYDSKTKTLYLGALEGHAAIANRARLDSLDMSGLVLSKTLERIYFTKYSGWYPRELTADDRKSIKKALEDTFGLPTVHGTPPGVGNISRPGAPKR